MYRTGEKTLIYHISAIIVKINHKEFNKLMVNKRMKMLFNPNNQKQSISNLISKNNQLKSCLKMWRIRRYKRIYHHRNKTNSFHFKKKTNNQKTKVIQTNHLCLLQKLYTKYRVTNKLTTTLRKKRNNHHL